MWTARRQQIEIQFKEVSDKLKIIFRSPEKARKKKNYALKKVEQPPSDNE